MFSSDIGIDLGTASVLVYIKGKGVVLKEPSVVAFDRDTNKIKAIGEEARLMLEDTRREADEVVAATQQKLKELRSVTNEYVLDALRQAEETVASALREVETARVRFESLAGPKQETTAPEIVEETAEVEAENLENG